MNFDIQALPSAVLWAAAIGGFLGFLLGSVPLRGENRGWSFDGLQAIIWGAGAAAGFGAVVLVTSTGAWFPAVYGFGFAFICVLAAVGYARPHRVPQNGNITEVVNRVSGETARDRLKAARRLYNNASFQSERSARYFATRAPREFSFGKNGATQDVLEILRDSVSHPRSETFDILVILVRELPDEKDQPAVVVARGGSNLLRTQVENDGITVPGYDKKIPAASIEALVGYAWR